MTLPLPMKNIYSVFISLSLLPSLQKWAVGQRGYVQPSDGNPIAELTGAQEGRVMKMTQDSSVSDWILEPLGFVLNVKYVRYSPRWTQMAWIHRQIYVSLRNKSNTVFVQGERYNKKGCEVKCQCCLVSIGWKLGCPCCLLSQRN